MYPQERVSYWDALHINGTLKSKKQAGGQEHAMKITVALALCALAAEGDAFAPTACRSSVAGMRSQSAVCSRSQSAVCSLHMRGEERSVERRALLWRGAALLLPLAVATPASAFEIPNPKDLLGDQRGMKPSGLGPIDGRFLSTCDSDNCVSTSDDVYRCEQNIDFSESFAIFIHCIDTAPAQRANCDKQTAINHVSFHMSGTL